MQRLEISLLGGFHVRVDGHPVPGDAWRQRRAADLAKLLALAPTHRMTRDEVVEALWPHLGADAGLANLHKAAHLARRALGDRAALVLRAGQVALAFEGKGRAHVLHIAGRVVGRATFEPGWRWSGNVKPIARTDSCRVPHLGYCLSGRMKVIMDDGSAGECRPGDVVAIPPGHDAEVVGDDPCVFIDFGEFGDYAKRA